MGTNGQADDREVISVYQPAYEDDTDEKYDNLL